jgi:uncharacterized protein
MLIQDKVYGDTEISEQVLVDLINSKELQRLKEISQLGLPKEYDHRPYFTRYDHSIGVLILLRRLDASVEEQIAGLLHDVSHTAFSHVVDVIFGDATKEDYQDNIHQEMIKNSDIPQIISKYNLEYESISNTKNFSLLERPSPSLCADRVDYTLQELALLGEYDVIRLCLDNLINIGGQIVFTNTESALAFANAYLKLQKESWGEDESRARYYILTKILNIAFGLGIISKEDLLKTDKYVMNILENKGNKEIIENLNLLKNGFKLIKDDDGIELKSKFRYINPEVLINDKIVLLTNLSNDYKNKLNKEISNKNNYVKAIILKK